MKNKIFKIFIYVALVFFALKTIITIGNFIVISTSEEYEIAKSFISKNSTLKTKIGTIKEFGMFPKGGLQNINGINLAQIETKVSGDLGNAYVIILIREDHNKNWIVDKFIISEVE